MFIILIYLPRPINSRNTIVRKGELAVVFLGSIFLKTLNMRSRVNCLLKTSISNNTHSVCCFKTDQRGQSPSKNEEMTGQTSNVAFMLTGQFLKTALKN